MRPKKRKSGADAYTKERENAILTMPDNSCIEGAGEVTKKMQEILSLDYRQFKQISMIAQGEFARLLTETPGEKIKIFRELFGTNVLEQFANNLRTKSNSLYKQVMEYRHRMDEDMKLLQTEDLEWRELADSAERNFDDVFSCLDRLQTAYKGEKKAADKQFEKLEKEEKKLSVEVAEAIRENQLLEKLEQKEAQFAELQSQEPEYKEKEKEAALIRKAQLTEPDFIHFRNAAEQLKKQKKLLERLELERREICERLEDNRFFYENKEALAALAEAEEKQESYKEERQKKSEELKKKQIELEKRKAEYLLSEGEARISRERLEKAEEEYRRSAIGIAVKMLKPHQPCPVCGSVEHPNPAQTAEMQMDEKLLKELREKQELVNAKMLKVHEKALVAQTEEAAILTELEKMEAALSQAAQDVKKSCDAIKIQTLQSIEEKDKDKTSGKDFENWLTLSAGEKKRNLEQKITAYQKEQTLQEEKKETTERAKAELEEVTNNTAELEKNYHQSIVQQGLKDEKTFLSYIERKGDEAELTKQCNRFKEELKSMADLIEHLKEEMKACKRLQKDEQGNKRRKADTKETEDRLRLLAEEKKEISKVRMNTAQKISEITKTRQALKEKQAKQEQLSKEYGIVKDLDNLASGNNAKRLVFEQYVLSAYFEQVLEAANIRFHKMTAGRYEMFRSQEVTDGRSKDSLEICVMDYYTGKARPVKTLSGGESFKASLALALGLSDVIGRTNGGIQVETLFIDEGFGALDSESLEQACETLTTLVEKDRLIGIISHVQELRERIDNQIIIRKTNSGSRIEMC